ncbi:MAG TPA: DNA polymerase III subunit delta' [Xanthomonadaceae bacterium]|nr:DNA polymerase III subunit delta' [Xanthomonadaceae bacterium]
MKLAPWQAEAFERAIAAHAHGRLGHALLVCGPPGTGKRGLAWALAGALLCREPTAQGACGRCRACQLFAAGTHADLHRVEFETRDDGRLRTEIIVEQVRRLAEKLSMTPQLGGACVAVIDPADAMNPATANALLKTLEEPIAGRYLLLLADRPGRLPATVRSRCHRIELRAVPPGQALSWLCERGCEEATARQALALAEGSPGVAVQLMESGALELARSTAQDLAALARGSENPARVARAWLEGDVSRRVALAAMLVREIGRSRQDRAATSAIPEVGALADLTAHVDFPKLAAWFDAANRCRDLLATPVRAELLLGQLLVGWNEIATAR